MTKERKDNQPTPPGGDQSSNSNQEAPLSTQIEKNHRGGIHDFGEYVEPVFQMPAPPPSPPKKQD